MHECFALLVALTASGLASDTSAVARQSITPEGIIFSRDGDLYATAVDGARARTVRLTNTRLWEVEPAVSPDGQRIAYGQEIARGSRRYDLWTMDLDGANKQKLTSAGETPHPSWTPDGEAIYFTRDVSYEFDSACQAIFRIGADDRGVTRVTRRARALATQRDPAVAPDGTRIAFSAWTDCEGSGVTDFLLRSVAATGEPTKDLLHLPRSDAMEPTWAPNGRRVAFATVNTPQRIRIVERGGRTSRAITPTRLIPRDPTWSPDGQWIAFRAYIDSPSPSHWKDLYVVRPDGTGLRRIMRSKAEETAPAWLPMMPPR